ncbi:thiolase family protein [Streptomyces sp. NPDC051217]|uniref:thiolase family protein n=1 Tax=Streptomyces sp. NPDC051217 TaxID=3365644 RepID=UPI00379B109B
MKRVLIAGAAVEPFGKKVGENVAEIGGRSLQALLRSSGVAPEQVDAGIVGSVYGGSLIAQRVMQHGAIAGPPVFTVENACASGGTAVHLACQAVAAGTYECVAVVGVDQLSVFGGGALPLTTNDIEIAQGVVMPATYAMRAQRYLHDYGADTASLDAVSVKNRGNGALNPRAHFQKPVAQDEVGQSRPVADPLRLLHCCPNSDGAAAVLVCSEDFARSLGRPTVAVRASVVLSGQFHTGYRDMTWPDITFRAAAQAYRQAELEPRDIDLVELHDAFSIAELLHAEALGISERGQAHRDVREGAFARDGRVAVSPSGGLLSRGHPVGATGVSQIAESYWQLTGQAEALQIDNARIALTHATGGGIFGVDNGACSVHILEAGQ